MATFHNECPYTVPICKERRNETEDEYKITVLKYRLLSKPGEALDIEETDTYTDRMIGILYVYSALLVTGASYNKSGTEGFHSYRDLWAWLARILKLPYREIYADLLLVFLKQSTFFFI